MSLPTQRLVLDIDKSKPFVILQSDEALGWGKLNHPFLRKINDERLALTYWVAGDGYRGGKAPVPWPAYSDDGFKSVSFGDPFDWHAGPPADIQTEVTEDDVIEDFNKGIFFAHAQLQDGRIYMHQRGFNSRNGFAGTAVRQIAEDGAYEVVTVKYHWPEQDENTEAGIPFKRPGGMAFESPAIVDKQNCIYTVSYGAIGHGRNREKYKTYLFKSCDQGLNFHYVSTVATAEHCPWGRLGPCEPAILELADGALMVVMRTDGGGAGDMSGVTSTRNMLKAVSYDDGLTWEHQRMPVPGVMPKLYRMSNGIIALAFGRPGNNLIFSTDEGNSWGAQTVITSNKRTTGYLDLIEVEPGRLLVVNDLLNESISNFWLWEPTLVNALIGRYVDVRYRF